MIVAPCAAAMWRRTLICSLNVLFRYQFGRLSMVKKSCSRGISDLGENYAVVDLGENSAVVLYQMPRGKVCAIPASEPP